MPLTVKVEQDTDHIDSFLPADEMSRLIFRSIGLNRELTIEDLNYLLSQTIEIKFDVHRTPATKNIRKLGLGLGWWNKLSGKWHGLGSFSGEGISGNIFTGKEYEARNAERLEEKIAKKDNSTKY